MTDIAGLVERLEAATGPDRELDLDLARALVPDVIVSRRNSDDTANEPYTYWEYTGSIDAALSLVERKLPTDYHFFELSIGHKRAHCEIHDQRIYDPIGTADAPTAPLALLIALLKALEQKATAP